jgi:AcrR family transcriptional regulator
VARPDRRRQIIDGALEAVRAAPVADVPLAAIAARAGLRASHVLYYFASRDDVLIAAVAHAEQALAEGRAERLAGIEDWRARLSAYVRAYLPHDRHDPVWKLWVEAWLRSPSRDSFAVVGNDADRRWHADLVAALEHAAARGARLPEPAGELARRLLFVLDGLAVHVLAGHVTADAAAALAERTLRHELPGPPTG